MRAARRPGACPCPPSGGGHTNRSGVHRERRTRESLRCRPSGGGHTNRSGVHHRRRTHESLRCPPSGGGHTNRSGVHRERRTHELLRCPPQAADTRIAPVPTTGGGRTNCPGVRRPAANKKRPAPHGTGVVRPRYHPRCAAAPPSRPATPLTAPRRRARLTRASPVMALPLITVGAPAEPTGVGHRGSRSLARSVGGSGGIFARRGCARLAPSRARLAAAGDGLLAPSQPVCRV